MSHIFHILLVICVTTSTAAVLSVDALGGDSTSAIYQEHLQWAPVGNMSLLGHHGFAGHLSVKGFEFIASVDKLYNHSCNNLDGNIQAFS